MRLVRIEDQKEMANIQQNKVVYLHPTIERVINQQGRIVLPALKNYKDMFGGYIVTPDHKKWAKAMQIYLEHDWRARYSNLFQWANNDHPNN